MKNYSLVANTQFKARTFEDLIKPYAMYTQEYRNQEDALAELATKADVWEGLANEQTDPIAYAQYKRYADAVKDQATAIASGGLDASSRQAMLNLKRRYASEITPIEQAFNTRKAQAAEQRQALLQNPTLMLSRRADSTSLDAYMDNPNLGYESYSGALLTQQVGQAAAVLAKELKEYGEGKPLDAYTNTWLQRHGYKASEVAFAINNPNDPRASNVLNTIVNNVMADSGMANWADNKTLDQAFSYARQGLWQAVGQTQVDKYENYGARLAAQEAMQQRMARYQQKLAEEKEGKKDPVDPTARYNNRVIVDSTNKGLDEIAKFNKYKHYFYKKNGRVYMTWEGRQIYKSGEKAASQKRGQGQYPGTNGNIDFYVYANSHGFSGIAHNNNSGPGQTKTFDYLKATAGGATDASVANEFEMAIAPTNFEGLASTISARANKNGEIYNYDIKKQSNGKYELVKSNSTVNKSEFTKDNILGARMVYGTHANYVEIDLKDEDHKEKVRIPYTVLTNRNSNASSGNIQQAARLQEMANSGVTHYKHRDGTVVPIYEEMSMLLNNAGDNMIKSLGFTQVEPEKIKQNAEYDE